MKPRKQLVAHPLVQKVQNNLQPLLEAAGSKLKELWKEGKWRNKEPAKLLEYQWYDHNVFTQLSAIISATERLEQSQIFIRTFPKPRSYEKLRINQYTWIEYHYSNYIITLVGLFDIALILTNSVFRLGNQERDCKTDLITMNSWVANTPVQQALKNLDNLIKPHREGRNLHVHRGTVPDIATAMGEEELDLLKAISPVWLFGKLLIDRKIVDFTYKKHVGKICKALQTERNEIDNMIWQLFDNLLPIYVEKSTALHEKWRLIFEKELGRRKNLHSKPN